MTASPGPFEVAKQISNNLGQSVERQGDISALDKILANVTADGTDEEINNAMAQIVQRVSPGRQKAALGVLQNQVSQRQKDKRRQAVIDADLPASAADLPDSALVALLRNQGKQAPETSLEKATAREQAKQQFKDLGEKRKFESALDVVNRQKQLLGVGNLGPKVGIGGTGRKLGSTFSAEGREDRAEFRQLGKSLISFASTITVRNRHEFQVLADKLFDPNATQEQIRGSLKGMERLITDTLKGLGTGVEVQATEQVTPGGTTVDATARLGEIFA